LGVITLQLILPGDSDDPHQVGHVKVKGTWILAVLFVSKVDGRCPPVCPEDSWL